MFQFKDKNNLSITASSEATIRNLEIFEESLLGSLNTVDDIFIIAENDKQCPLAQIYSALLHISSSTNLGYIKAEKYLNVALELFQYTTPREQAIIESTKLWFFKKRHLSASILDQILTEYPTDIISAKWAQLLYFEIGSSAGILKAPLKVAKSFENNAHIHGMLAYGYEECYLLEKAEKSVNKALKIQPSEPWAHHAMAHICESKNAIDYGLSFMYEYSHTWEKFTPFITTHNWWHLSLFMIDLGQEHKVLDLFDSYVWNKDKNCIYEQINAISLLYRLERIGIDVGTRWNKVAEYAEQYSDENISIFLNFHILYILKKVDNKKYLNLSKNMTSLNENYSIEKYKTSKKLAKSIEFLLDNNYKKSIQYIEEINFNIQEIGGSHAQRDIINLFYIDSLIGGKKWEEAQQMLSKRHFLRPKTLWIKRQLEYTYNNLGFKKEELLQCFI